MEKLLIIGAGGYGKLVSDLAYSLNKYDKISFLDDNLKGVLGKVKDAYKFVDEYKNAIVAIGNNPLRETLTKSLEELGYNIVNIISPSAYIAKTAKIGKGIVIEPFSLLHTNTVIENGCFISAGAIVNHDAVVKEFSHVDCGAIISPYQTVSKYVKVIAGSVYVET